MSVFKARLARASWFFAFVAFMLLFASPITLSVEDYVYKMDFSNVYFNSSFDGNMVYGATGGFIGFILILLGGIYFDWTKALRIKHDKFICIGVAIIMVAGAILILCTCNMWLQANFGTTDTNLVTLGAAPIVASIFGIISAILGVYSRWFRADSYIN